MSDSTEMAQRHDRILAELAELGLGLARAVQERALAAEDAKSAADLGLAFHRISRTVRQTIALEAKLERDRRRDERERQRDEADDIHGGRSAAPPRDVAGIARRKAEIRAAVERVIWDEAERKEADYLVELLDERLEIAGRAHGFLRAPLERQIEALCADFGLCPPPPDAAAPDGESDAEPGREVAFDASPRGPPDTP